MDAYACWLMSLTGTDSAWRGHLWRVLQTLGEENPGNDGADLVRELYHMDQGALMLVVNRAMEGVRHGTSHASTLLEFLIAGRRKEPERILETVMARQMQCAMYYEETFPEALREIPDPPLGIYWKGRLPDADRPTVAVIGARMSSPYGRAQARDFALELARNGVQIVSGMARGIDGIAGQAALEVSDDSYAVLGCGADLCYPEEHRELYQRLVLRGGVISEFPPGTEAVKTNFPQRNRIISALSQVVLVVEAREKSGTLITVDMAVEQGRDVFALPGRVTDRTSRGCNELIRQGAFPATCPDDLLTFLFNESAEHVRMRNKTVTAPEEVDERTARRKAERAARESAAQSRRSQQLRSLGAVDHAIYEILDESTPRGIDDLLGPVRERMGRRVSVSEVMRAVTGLLMAGLVKELRVGNYVKVPVMNS